MADNVNVTAVDTPLGQLRCRVSNGDPYPGLAIDLAKPDGEGGQVAVVEVDTTGGAPELRTLAYDGTIEGPFGEDDGPCVTVCDPDGNAMDYRRGPAPEGDVWAPIPRNLFVPDCWDPTEMCDDPADNEAIKAALAASGHTVEDLVEAMGGLWENVGLWEMVSECRDAALKELGAVPAGAPSAD